MDGWFSGSAMYVCHTNQISCDKGKWYARRFDPDTVENGHIYSSVKEEEVFTLGLPRHFLWVRQAEDFVGEFDSL